METDFSPQQFDWSNLRPQEKERLSLSGQTVTVRSHGGGGIGWRGKEYKPDAKGLIHDVPVECIPDVENGTFWANGKPFQQRLDVIGRDSELTPSEKS